MAQQIALDPPGTREAARRSVLVVEDDSAAYHAMCRLLEHYEFEVFQARTLAQALEHLERNPEVVLLDLDLPDGDGTEVLRKIRYAGKPIRVAVLTGIDDPGRIRRCKSLRPDLLLRKPIDFLRLLTLLRQAASLSVAP